MAYLVRGNQRIYLIHKISTLLHKTIHSQCLSLSAIAPGSNHHNHVGQFKSWLWHYKYALTREQCRQQVRPEPTQ